MCVRCMRQSLKQSREKLYMYLTGWTGGPPVYVEKYGHPRLRARHLPFTIGTQRTRRMVVVHGPRSRRTGDAG